MVPCIAWFKLHDFSVHVVDSKAVYSARAGRYLSGMAATGMTDFVGCTPLGAGCFVEAKAPGKLRDLKPHQREFLVEKIKRRAFGACVDSPERLARIYERWLVLPPSIGVEYLLNELPPEKQRRVPKPSVT